MRLRLTIQRHGLPDTLVLWPTQDEPSPTIAELLEAVHESVPIEAEAWGFEDYSVELRSTSGKGYECLHYQRVKDVFREDDEVLIRPLLTHDIKTRKRSGRHQISADGYRLYDGLAYGRTLTRALANRPLIKIPPRKKRRILYREDDDNDEDEDDDETDNSNLKALEATANIEPSRDGGKQLVLHESLDEDDDEADDDDFNPSEEEHDEDVGSSDDPNGDDVASQSSGSPTADEVDSSTLDSTAAADRVPPATTIEEYLRDVPDESTRIKLRSLQVAFPSAKVEVCKVLLDRTRGDVGETYEALSRGFVPSKSKAALLGGIRDFSSHVAISKPSKSLERARTLGSEVYDKTGYRSPDENVLELSVPKTRSSRQKLVNTAELTTANSSSSDAQPELDLTKLRQPLEGGFDGDEGEPESEEEDQEGEEVDSRTRYYDQNGFPAGSIQAGKLIKFDTESMSSPGRSGSPKPLRSGSNERDQAYPAISNLENCATPSPVIVHEEQKSNGDVTPTDTSSNDSESEDEDSSSSEEDGSSSDSSSSAQSSVRNAPHVVSSSSESDSDSSDSSSDDEAPEVVSSKLAPTNKAISQGEMNDSSRGTSSQSQVAATKGKAATRARNERRRNTHILRRLKENGILPGDTTILEYTKLDVNLKSSAEEAAAALDKLRHSYSSPSKDQSTSSKKTQQSHIGGSVSGSKQIPESSDFEARRSELLASLAAGGVDIMEFEQPIQESSQVTPTTTDVSAALPADSRQPLDVVPQTDTSPTDLHQNVRSPRTKTVLDATAAISPVQVAPVDSSHTVRRAKWDAGAGRRLLFGHLGVKAPKTKEDEEKVRQALMKDIRPAQAPRVSQAVAVNSLTLDTVDEDSETWLQKIKYRAVECTQEGIVLSTPPFPFVQRWDPQQQRGGKRKNSQREQSNIYEEPRKSKKQKKRKAKQSYSEHEEYLDESYHPSFPDSLDYDEDSLLVDTYDEVDEASQQLLQGGLLSQDVDGQEPHDLVPLPHDMSTLRDLEDGAARQGMTIAFKTLTMNARWEPEQSEYQTAIVIDILPEGDLNVLLAKRDRKQINYDEETGERVYDKFEMPIDDDDEVDDGFLSISYSTLQEPKIVQEAPAELGQAAIEKEFSEYSTRGLNEEQSPSDMEQQQSIKDSKAGVVKDACENDSSKGHSDTGISQPELHNQVEVQKQLYGESQEPTQDAQYSHITETPLPSVALEPEYAEQIEKSPPPQLHSTRSYSQSESIASNQSNGMENNSEDIHQPEPAVNTQPSFTQHAPLGKSITPLPTSKAKQPTDAISSNVRLEISHLIKDAGFRSKVASPIINGVQYDTQAPGDSAIFEKLMEKTEARNRAPYSPVFKDYASSSPVDGLDATPTPRQNIVNSSVQSSWITVDEPLSSPVAKHHNSQSPIQVQSSWETVNQTTSSPPPGRTDENFVGPTQDHVHNEDDSQDWETDVELPQSNSPNPKLQKVQSVASHPRKRVPVGAAQEMWEQLIGGTSRTSSPIASIEITPQPELPSLEDEITMKPYPAVRTTTTSFTSNIADHGRQPDFEVRDGPMLADAFEDFNEDIATSPAPESQTALGVNDELGIQREQIDHASSTIPNRQHSSKSPISARIAALMQNPKTIGLSEKEQITGVVSSNLTAPLIKKVPYDDAQQSVHSPCPKDEAEAIAIAPEIKRPSRHSSVPILPLPPVNPTDVSLGYVASPVLPPIVEKTLGHSKNLSSPPISPESSDSEDEYPPSDEVLSQRPAKMESPSQATPNHKDYKRAELKKADKNSRHEGSVDFKNSGRSSFRKSSKLSESTSLKTRSSIDPGSSIRELQPTASGSGLPGPHTEKAQVSAASPRVQLPASQQFTTMIDLTQSSDVEDEVESHITLTSAPTKKSMLPTTDSDEEVPFKQYNLDSDDEFETTTEHYVDNIKKENRHKNTSARGKKDLGGPRDSSQSSLNRNKGRVRSSKY